MSVYSYYGIHDESNNAYNILDPREQYKQARDGALPTDFWGKATSYTCSRGRTPGSAWMLLERSDVAAIKDSGEKVDLLWYYYDSDDTSITPDSQPSSTSSSSNGVALRVRNLTLVAADCMSRSYPGTDGAVYLAEFRDVRHLFQRLHFTSKRYNCRESCGTYEATTINASTGVAYTWQEMLDELWELLPAAYRNVTTPTLPYTPMATPENYEFIGMSPWEAIHQILWDISCTTAFDPTKANADNPFKYVKYGTSQSGYDSAIAVLENDRVFDFDPITPEVSYIPEKIDVVFDDPTSEAGYETITVDTNNVNAIAGTKIAIKANMLNCDDDDVVTIQDIAGERADNYVDKLELSDVRVKIKFDGIITSLLPGTQVKSVTWSNYGEVHEYGGTNTEITNEADMPPTRKDVVDTASDMWIVRFKITDGSGSGTLTVYAEVYSVPNGKSLADVPEYGLVVPNAIEICDPTGNVFNEPAAELLGRNGWAAYMQPLLPHSCDANNYYNEPHWEVIQLFCPKPSCD